MEELSWRERLRKEYSGRPQLMHRAEEALRQLDGAIQTLASLGFPLRAEEGFVAKPPEFPKVMFHIRQGSKVVRCKADEEELGPDWHGSMEDARQAAGMAKQWQRGGVFDKSLPAPISDYNVVQLRPEEPSEPPASRLSRVNALSPPKFGLPAVIMPGTRR